MSTKKKPAAKKSVKVAVKPKRKYTRRTTPAVLANAGQQLTVTFPLPPNPKAAFDLGFYAGRSTVLV